MPSLIFAFLIKHKIEILFTHKEVFYQELIWRAALFESWSHGTMIPITIRIDATACFTVSMVRGPVSIIILMSN